MTRAALGFRMHSGWGVLVAVSADANRVEVLGRMRIVVIDPEIDGAVQPYHYAASIGPGNQGRAKLSLLEAEKHIGKCASASERLARAEIEEVVGKLEARQYRIIGSAVLLASGRALPPLAKILSAHPLIHTAEGEFFRNVVRQACERLKIPVTAIPERELEDRAKTAFGNAAAKVQREIASLGSLIGPPWTKDHKAATLAAAILLAKRTR